MIAQFKLDENLLEEGDKRPELPDDTIQRLVQEELKRQKRYRIEEETGITTAERSPKMTAEESSEK